MLYGLPKHINIITSDTLQVSISHNACRVITYHAGTMTRSTPFGQEAALLIGIGPTLLHLLTHRRPHQVYQGEQGTEGIPEARIGKEIAWQCLAVIGTVVNNLAFGINLVEAAREEGTTIQATIESTQTVNITLILHIDGREYLVPLLTTSFSNLFKGSVAQLLQVLLGLFYADERAGHTNVNLLTALCSEAYHALSMLADSL